MKRLYMLVIPILLLASALPSAMAATYIIEHDGELNKLSRARSSRSSSVNPITVSSDAPSTASDDYFYSNSDNGRWPRFADDWGDDAYNTCIEDADDAYDDGGSDNGKYLNELQDCRRRYRSGHQRDGPLRSLTWFYEWRFNPKTFADRYCRPHLHRYPVTGGPTWYEISWTHGCNGHNNRHAYIVRPLYARAQAIVDYTHVDYDVEGRPATGMRPVYQKQEDGIPRYTFTPSVSHAVSHAVYPEGTHWHAQEEPDLEKRYNASAYGQLRNYCERTRATDGSMDAWCRERAHLWVK